MADPAEAEKAKEAVASVKKGGFWRIILWIMIILGGLFIVYQFLG